MATQRQRKGDDPVNPKHYAQFGEMSSINIIARYGLGFELGNVIKYVLRAGLKGSEIEDLKKARWYLNRRIHLLDPENEADPAKGPVTG